MSDNYDETALLTRIADLESQLKPKPSRQFVRPLTSVFFVGSCLPLLPSGGLYLVSKVVESPMPQAVIGAYLVGAVFACIGAFIFSTNSAAPQ